MKPRFIPIQQRVQSRVQQRPAQKIQQRTRARIQQRVQRTTPQPRTQYAHPQERKPVPVAQQDAGDILDNTQVWTPQFPPLDVGMFLNDVMNEQRFKRKL